MKVAPRCIKSSGNNNLHMLSMLAGAFLSALVLEPVHIVEERRLKELTRRGSLILVLCFLPGTFSIERFDVHHSYSDCSTWQSTARQFDFGRKESN
jgi:hypothetical protein